MAANNVTLTKKEKFIAWGLAWLTPRGEGYTFDEDVAFFESEILKEKKSKLN